MALEESQSEYVDFGKKLPKWARDKFRYQVQEAENCRKKHCVVYASYKNYFFPQYDVPTVSKVSKLVHTDYCHPKKGVDATLVLMPNKLVRATILNCTETKRNYVLVSKRNDDLRFFDDIEFASHIKRKSSTRDVLVSDEFYTAFAWTPAKQNAIVLSKEKLKAGTTYWMLSFGFRKEGTVKLGTAQQVVLEDIYIPIKTEEEKIKLEDIDALASSISSIKDISLQWDFVHDDWLYSEEEMWLIIANMLYVERGIAALNLILGGPTRTGKTLMIKLMSEIFQEDIIASTQLRQKGLLPSFYGTLPSPGALFSAKYVFLGDEFFRMFLSQRTGTLSPSTILRTGLGQLMEILEHDEKLISSGKGELRLVFKSSMMGIDNFKERRELNAVWREDDALINRFSFLELSDESVKKARGTSVLNRVEFVEKMKDRFAGVTSTVGTGKKQHQVMLTFDAYRRLFIYLRSMLHKVKYDNQRLIAIRNKIEQDTKTTHYFPLHEKARAILSAVVILNSLFRSNNLPTKFEAEDEDYDKAEELLRRLDKDMRAIFAPETLQKKVDVVQFQREVEKQTEVDSKLI